MIVETCYTQASDPDRYIGHETCRECKISEGSFSPPFLFPDNLRQLSLCMVNPACNISPTCSSINLPLSLTCV